MSNDNLSDLRICVQKLLPDEHKYLDNIHNTSQSTIQASKLSAAFFAAKIWPDGSVITMKFVDGDDREPNIPRTPTAVLTQTYRNKDRLDPLQYELENTPIKKAIKIIIEKRIKPIANLEFRFVNSDEDAYVRIGFLRNKGSWSLLGTDHKNSTDKITMNFGWFDVPTVIHEMGHVVGLVHEHQNPAGGIKWNDSKVYDWAAETQGWDRQTTYSNILKKYTHDQINGSNFDPCSIMLYFFPAELTTNNKGTEQNTCLSGTDVKWINHMYDNHINIDNYYDDTYKRTIESDMKFCKVQHGGYESAKKGLFGFKLFSDDTPNYVNIIIVVLIGLLILLLIINIMQKIFGSKKTNSGRSGRTERYRFY